MKECFDAENVFVATQTMWEWISAVGVVGGWYSPRQQFRQVVRAKSMQDVGAGYSDHSSLVYGKQRQRDNRIAKVQCVF